MPRRQRGQATVESKANVLEQLTIEYIPTGDVIPNDYNPNRQNEHEFALLCRSIREDGFTQPIIIGMDNRVVDGEHRWRAARELGLEQVPIVRVPMEAAQARIATLRHNRARGSEDVELSVAVLRDLEKLGALDWAADALEYDDTELQRLLDDIPAPEALASEEWSEAWMPGGGDEHKDTGAFGVEGTTDLTPEAADAVREREKALRDAKSEEERQAIRRDNAIFRVALTFTAEEAVVVKAVLGDTPAAKIVELCRAAYAEPVNEGEPVEASA